MMDFGMLGKAAVGSLVFTLIGVAVFTAVFFLLARAMPFSIRKEIEEDQNVALGIVIGALVLGLSIIIAAAIHG